MRLPDSEVNVSPRSSRLVVVAIIASLGCAESGPPTQPIQVGLATVQASPLPCRGRGPCPPNPPCPPDPPCDPQYLVTARLQVELASDDSFEVQSVEAGLYDTHSVRVAGPQRGSLPTFPLRIAARRSEWPLSFLTGPGAEIVGGAVRVLVIGTDARGVQWAVSADAMVGR